MERTKSSSRPIIGGGVCSRSRRRRLARKTKYRMKVIRSKQDTPAMVPPMMIAPDGERDCCFCSEVGSGISSA